MAWADLTNRQKELDRAIDQSGVKIDSSNNCLKKIMKIIGAKDNEASYVQSRINLRIRTKATLDNTDIFINQTEQMLQAFDEDEKEWERKGRALGFNFWDKNK